MSENREPQIMLYYKDRKCAVNENPCSAQIVPVKLSEYLPYTRKRLVNYGMKNK